MDPQSLQQQQVNPMIPTDPEQQPIEPNVESQVPHQSNVAAQSMMSSAMPVQMEMELPVSHELQAGAPYQSSLQQSPIATTTLHATQMTQNPMATPMTQSIHSMSSVPQNVLQSNGMGAIDTNTHNTSNQVVESMNPQQLLQTQQPQDQPAMASQQPQDPLHVQPQQQEAPNNTAITAPAVDGQSESIIPKQPQQQPLTEVTEQGQDPPDDTMQSVAVPVPQEMDIGDDVAMKGQNEETQQSEEKVEGNGTDSVLLQNQSPSEINQQTDPTVNTVNVMESNYGNTENATNTNTIPIDPQLTTQQIETEAPSNSLPIGIGGVSDCNSNPMAMQVDSNENAVHSQNQSQSQNHSENVQEEKVPLDENVKEQLPEPMDVEETEQNEVTDPVTDPIANSNPCNQVNEPSKSVTQSMTEVQNENQNENENLSHHSNVNETVNKKEDEVPVSMKMDTDHDNDDINQVVPQQQDKENSNIHVVETGNNQISESNLINHQSKLQQEVTTQQREAEATTSVTTTTTNNQEKMMSVKSDKSSNPQQSTVLPELVECGKLLREFMKRPETEPFNEPVDWKGLNLPDYPLIIRNQMDLGTVHKRLEVGKYATADKFAEDIRLVFKNAMTYNTPGSGIYVVAENLFKQFERRFARITKIAPYKRRKNNNVERVNGESSTFEQRQKFTTMIQQLTPPELGGVVELIDKKSPQALMDANGNEEELDIEVYNIDAETLKELIAFIEKTIQKRSKKKKKAYY